MNVQLDKKENLNATLIVELQKDDYIQKFDQMLKDFRKKGNFKGFRQGKAPMGYIRKIYGQSALADAVNDTLQKAVGDYLKEHDVKYIGQPLPSDEQDHLDFDAANPDNYTFVFDMGLVPEFELNGTEAEIKRYDVEVADESVEREWSENLVRMGQPAEVEEDIQEKDVMFLKVVEKRDAEGEEQPLEASFALAVEDIGDEDIKKLVLKAKKGDTFTFNPATLEKGRDLDFVKKYHLGLEDEMEREIAEVFDAVIERVQRQMPAEVDQELFDKMFGPETVSSEEEAKEEIRKLIKDSLDRQADAVLYRRMQESLMEANEMTLPEEFLTKWLDFNRKEGEPEPSDQDRADFLRDLKWQLIKEKIADKHQLEVTHEEIQEGAYRRVAQYIGPYGDEAMVQRLMSAVLGNEDQVQRIAQEALANKVFVALKGTFNVTDEPIAEEAFMEEADKVLGPRQ